MHYLKLALLAEGPSDHRFLPFVLRRLTVDLCSRHARRIVDVENDVLDLTALRRTGYVGQKRALQTHQILRDSAEDFDVLFIHADGGGNPQGAREYHFAPLADWVKHQSLIDSSRLVAVIPVREMEAWALADGEAIRNALGTDLDDGELGVPERPRDVESIPDPKVALNQAYDEIVGRRRRKKERASTFLSSIGAEVRLDRLRQVPAFQELDRDLRQGLDDLGYFR